jgi:hypothetical protein
MKKLLFTSLLVLIAGQLQAQNVRVGECPDGDCTKAKNTQIVVEKVDKVRDRDVKAGLCVRSKVDESEYKFLRKDDTFAVALEFDEDRNVIKLDEMMLIRDKYHDLLTRSVPVPCDQTIFGDEEYITACKNGSKEWGRVNYCLDRKTLRRQQMYGLE